MTEDLWPPLRTMPDGTPCWCLSAQEPHAGWVHAPACIARRVDRTLVIAEDWIVGEFPFPSTHADTAEEAAALVLRADGWHEVYWGRGAFVLALADRLHHMFSLPPIQRHVVTPAALNPTAVAALLRQAGYDNVEEAAYVKDPLEAARAERLSLPEINRRAGAARVELPDQYRVHYPHLKVSVPEKGQAVLTRVELDGKQIPATRVAFDTGADLNGQVIIKLEFVGSIEFDSDAPLTLTGVDRPAG